MGDQAEFKHIKVGSNIDDNVVYVGASSSNDSKSSIMPCGATVIQESADKKSVANTVVSAEPLTGTLTAAPAGISEVQNISRSHANTAHASTSHGHDDYHATTLADIEESKMPRTQIIVIALALIAIAVFIIWYILAM